ncbi:hypothetical protein [Paenibacillus bovis]|uniref:Uncharacterized protein n=1 Tax=Paenibacillus bovis TaxID=1616788 RepID=A0A172ZM41_9BACL|nr:hypothetical protein [Paenibacillus bovis]ANF98190.1 hypothetical protein AR543_20690 [Paenibacillus bovis]
MIKMTVSAAFLLAVALGAGSIAGKEPLSALFSHPNILISTSDNIQKKGQFTDMSLIRPEHKLSILALQHFKLANGETNITFAHHQHEVVIMSVHNTSKKRIDINIIYPDSVTSYQKAHLSPGQTKEYTLSLNKTDKTTAVGPFWYMYAVTSDGSSGSMDVSVRASTS